LGSKLINEGRINAATFLWNNYWHELVRR